MVFEAIGRSAQPPDNLPQQLDQGSVVQEVSEVEAVTSATKGSKRKQQNTGRRRQKPEPRVEGEQPNSLDSLLRKRLVSLPPLTGGIRDMTDMDMEGSYPPEEKPEHDFHV